MPLLHVAPTGRSWFRPPIGRGVRSPTLNATVQHDCAVVIICVAAATCLRSTLRTPVMKSRGACSEAGSLSQQYMSPSSSTTQPALPAPLKEISLTWLRNDGMAVGRSAGSAGLMGLIPSPTGGSVQEATPSVHAFASSMAPSRTPNRHSSTLQSPHRCPLGAIQ